MSGERKPGWFWHLDRWNLGIAGVLLAIIVVVGAIILINDRPKAVPRPATPVAFVPTPGPTAAAPGSQATAGGNLAGTATALPPAQAGAATAASGTAAAGTAAAGTAATQQGMLTAAPGAGQATPASPTAAVTAAAVTPAATTLVATTEPAAATQTGAAAVKSTPGAGETTAAGGTPVASTTLTPAAAGPATPANAQAAAVPAAATPAAAVTTVAATPVAARTPARLGNLSVVPPVLVPEAEFPVSVPGAPALGSLAGSAPPGSVISIFDGNTLLGQVQAGADGLWRFPVPSTLSPGRHVLTAVFLAAGATAGGRPLMIVLSAPVIVSAAGEARPAFEAARALAGNAPLLPT